MLRKFYANENKQINEKINKKITKKYTKNGFSRRFKFYLCLGLCNSETFSIFLKYDIYIYIYIFKKFFS